MIVNGDAFIGLNKVCEYLKRHSTTNDLIKPEFEAAVGLIERIRVCFHFDEEDVASMLSRVNEVEKGEHYNGTGWHDFKTHLRVFFKDNGFSVSLTADGCLSLKR